MSNKGRSHKFTKSQNTKCSYWWVGGWLKVPFVLSVLRLCAILFEGKFVFNIATMMPPPGELVREVFSSGQASVSGAAYGGRFRLAELFLDLVALATSHHRTLFSSTAPIDTFHNKPTNAYEYKCIRILSQSVGLLTEPSNLSRTKQKRPFEPEPEGHLAWKSCPEARKGYRCNFVKVIPVVTKLQVSRPTT